MDIAANFKNLTGVEFDARPARQGIVLETPDFRRIRDLPRYSWEVDPAIPDIAQALTNALKTPHGTQALRPAQAACLKAAVEVGGVLGAMRVGAGKTLPTFLIPVLYRMLSGGQRAQRPLLLNPASLIQKTRGDMRAAASHWKVCPLTLVSYEKLSRDYTSDKPKTPQERFGSILGGLQPDLIIADECHKLKNTKSAVWRKLRRYFKWCKENGIPLPKVFLSGSITTRSIKDYWHLAVWALGENCPLPTDPVEVNDWALALDERVDPEMRVLPGALERLSPGAEGADALSRARNAYMLRLTTAPGFVGTKADRPGMSLTIRAVEIPAPPAVREAVTYMRTQRKTPDDHPIDYPTQLWAHCVEAQCGFYYVWDPRPPVEYLDARFAWNTFKNEALKVYKRIDSPGALAQAIIKGQVQDHGIYAEWCRQRDSFKPNSVPVWMDDTLLKKCAEWIHSNAHGLCWVGHGAFGRKLSEMSGVPYFARKGLDPSGKSVEKHRGPAIVSVKACREGLNLQHWHYQNLYPYVPSTPDAWEQTLGRTHRDGQPEDEVTAEVFMVCQEAYSALVWAVRLAESIEQKTMELQKLCYATRDLGSVEAMIARRSDDMWKYEAGI